jgi:hypothetical protein
MPGYPPSSFGDRIASDAAWAASHDSLDSLRTCGPVQGGGSPLEETTPSARAVPTCCDVVAFHGWKAGPMAVQFTDVHFNLVGKY